MQGTENTQGTLFATENGKNAAHFPLSPLENRVREACEQIIAQNPDDYLAPALGELAMDLARNITLGNRKGRAVAHEAQQLAAVLDQMRGEETEEESSQLPATVVEFVEAMKNPPLPPSSIEAVS